jgi:hypothetical protein
MPPLVRKEVALTNIWGLKRAIGALFTSRKYCPELPMWATKFTLGALKGLMVENRKKGMVKIGF